MDNAALAAIIFLEKGLSMTTHRCKITALGETPQLGVLHYVASRSEVASMLRSQDAALKAEKVSPPLSNLPFAAHHPPFHAAAL